MNLFRILNNAGIACGLVLSALALGVAWHTGAGMFCLGLALYAIGLWLHTGRDPLYLAIMFLVVLRAAIGLAWRLTVGHVLLFWRTLPQAVADARREIA